MGKRSAQDSAQLAGEQLQNALDILVSLLGGEVAVVSAENQAEGNALLALGDTGTGVDVEQGNFLQQALGTAADAVLQ